MAAIIENDKKFRVIEVSLEEINSWGGLGICDLCTNRTYPQYYIAVLNMCYCKSCYETFVERATHYPEDKDFEEQNFSMYRQFLKL